MRITFNFMIWYVHQCLKALGMWGIVGLVILLVTAMMTYTTIVSSARENDAANQSLLLAQSNNTTQAITPTDKAQPVDTAKPVESINTTQTSTDALVSLLAKIPEERQLPKLLNLVYETAKRAQLTILKADYKWRKLKKTAAFSGGNIVQYEISFPVKGSYTAIRAMLNNVLAQIPMLAIDRLELNRENVSSTLTEAKVTFVVFLMDGNE